jgi:asparagine synthase (glutamine-hydrolysing)
MCGIAGYASNDSHVMNHDEIVSLMINGMRHRNARHISKVQYTSNVCIGYSGISINDLDSGLQPFTNQDKTISCFMNGEIYNWKSIRIELQNSGYHFRTSCDAEVIPFLYEKYGEKFVEKLDGIFAICIHDSNRKQIILVRDRVGIKPLYYSFSGKQFLFASEMTSLLASNVIARELDLQSVSEFFTFRCVPYTNTILASVKRLASGSQLIFNYQEWQISQHTYWQPNLWQSSLTDEAQACDLLREKVISSVHRQTQLPDETPIGVLLSGGIDSSSVTRLARLNLPDKQIFTFSVNVKDDPEDFTCVNQVVQAANTIQHTVDCTQEDVASIPYLIIQLGEPISAGFLIPIYQGLNLAQTHGVPVVLLGDGSDELFAGYSGRLVVDSIIKEWDSLTTEKQQHYLNQCPILAGKLKSDLYNSKLTPLERYALWDDDNTFDSQLKAQIFLPQHSPISDPLERLHELDVVSEGARHENRMLFLEMKIRVEGFTVAIIERMAMACSVEARVPFLDQEIVDFAYHISPHLKYSNGIEKYILRRTMMGIGGLPETVLWRKKHPLSGSIPTWVTALERLLSSSVIQKQGILNEKMLINYLSTYKHTKLSQSDRIRYSDILFASLIFTIWVELFIYNSSADSLLVER